MTEKKNGIESDFDESHLSVETDASVKDCDHQVNR